jgi:hypothetical protein
MVDNNYIRSEGRDRFYFHVFISVSFSQDGATSIKILRRFQPPLPLNPCFN